MEFDTKWIQAILCVYASTRFMHVALSLDTDVVYQHQRDVKIIGMTILAYESFLSKYI